MDSTNQVLPCTPCFGEFCALPQAGHCEARCHGVTAKDHDHGANGHTQQISRDRNAGLIIVCCLNSSGRLNFKETMVVARGRGLTACTTTLL